MQYGGVSQPRAHVGEIPTNPVNLARQEMKMIDPNTNCSRCKQNKLTVAESSTPRTLKGGFSGFFCIDCMNDWNAAYHNSPVCATYRVAEIQYEMLTKAILYSKIDAEELLNAAGEVADQLTTAMHGLYALAIEWNSKPDWHPTIKDDA